MNTFIEGTREDPHGGLEIDDQVKEYRLSIVEAVMEAV